ncbi:Mrp complex subunit C1 [Salinivirga cyanobacteriivorans]|uniref:Mrp complex subunit C1 n=1 Tax=Salinivirga cyanobacteriivorans TaxID=1307839 RepID=A0A0S2HY12_9BACT|nr:NADH-quinone oxidoreductase subunit K [Salinivirga cyanobacteriivorans]ALO14907.1 Mrp complex subunit C1 [Salinivirga cyanobacteriivorans]
MMVFIMCFILFLVGLYGVLTRRNLIKIVIGLTVMEFSVFLFLVLIGYIANGEAPIIVPGIKAPVFVDPLPQAMVLTAIVIGLATTAMLLSIAIRIYKKYGTWDIREIKNLRG